jgi:hypothetical protein
VKTGGHWSYDKARNAEDYQSHQKLGEWPGMDSLQNCQKALTLLIPWLKTFGF